MKVAFHLFALALIVAVPGCMSGRAIEAPLSVAGAVAGYHAENNAWPETREDLGRYSAERMPLDLRESDEIWISPQEDGSVIVTVLVDEAISRSGMAVRIVPPKNPPTTTTTTTTNSDAASARDDYSFHPEQFRENFGRRIR